MALASAANGTQTATINTEHSLSTQTTVNFFQLSVNLTNLANGDTVEIRLKTKTLTGDTAEEVFYAIFANDQGPNPITLSPPLPSLYSLEATLKQTTGTGRAFPWNLLSW
jgi:hypothetical protein